MAPAANAALADPARDDAALRALFDRARDGDGDALNELCRCMRPRLVRTALAVVHDVDDADDIAQEALVRAMTRRFLFLGTGSVGGWMTRIALNLAKNRRRDSRRRGEILAAAPPGDLVARGAVASAAVVADHAVLERERRDRLRQALERLPAFDGAVRRYEPAFTPPRHDALTSREVRFVRMEQGGALVPVK